MALNSGLRGEELSALVGRYVVLWEDTVEPKPLKQRPLTSTVFPAARPPLRNNDHNDRNTLGRKR